MILRTCWLCRQVGTKHRGGIQHGSVRHPFNTWWNKILRTTQSIRWVCECAWLVAQKHTMIRPQARYLVSGQWEVNENQTKFSRYLSRSKEKGFLQHLWRHNEKFVSRLILSAFVKFVTVYHRPFSCSTLPPGPQKEITLAITGPRCSSRNPGAWNPVVWYSPAHGFWWSLPVGDFTGYQKSYFEHLKMLTTLRTGTSISSGIRYATLAMPMVNGSAQAQNCTHPHQQHHHHHHHHPHHDVYSHPDPPPPHHLIVTHHHHQQTHRISRILFPITIQLQNSICLLPTLHPPPQKKKNTFK